MADQIQKTKSKTQVLEFKPPRLNLKTFMIGLCVLVASICSVITATCPSTASTTTDQCNFTGSPSTYAFGYTIGPVSNNIYYFLHLSPQYKTAIRKVDESGSLTWMASFAFRQIWKSRSVDAAEQSVYIAVFVNILVVLRLATSNGSIVSQHQL